MTDKPRENVYHWRLLLALGIGAAMFWLAGMLHYTDPEKIYPSRMAAGVTGFVAACWLSSALPMAAASLMPLCLMPLLGVIPISKSATSYAHPILWMFFGGFVLALGIERWGLHKRIALGIIQRFGTKPSRLILGFMCASAFLSMWLNNTSTTLMLLPIALALVSSMSAAGAMHIDQEKNFAFTLLLGVAYAASIGGTGTPIGTAPNALYLSNYASFEKAGAPPMTFLNWLIVVVPLVVVMIPLVWILLTKVLAPVGQSHPQAEAVLAQQALALPTISRSEKRMLALFLLAALLWTTRRDLDLGEFGTIPGWWNLLPVPDARYLGDGSVAVFVALLSFIVPSGKRRGQALMNWETARHLPWDILLLIGGGIAIAESFKHTGLAAAVGSTLQPVVATLPPIAQILLIAGVMTFLTEVTSNTAMTSLMLPILSAASVAAGTDPRILMFPAALSASCAFMLPISTPPNAIVFSSGRIPMARMARTGVLINFLGIVLITLLMWTLARPVLQITMTQCPPWVRP